jgi:predicted DNA-binding transcriptional regulator AlpA
VSRRASLSNNAAIPPPPPAHDLLTAERAAEAVGLSLAALWRAVAAGRLPAPVYPASRAPRWYRHELHAALAETRAKPREAMAERRAAKIAASRAA